MTGLSKRFGAAARALICGAVVSLAAGLLGSGEANAAPVIDVLVVMTTKARTANPTLSTLIGRHLTNLNTALNFQNKAIASVRVVGIVAVGSGRNASSNLLNELKDGGGIFASVPSARRAYKADMVLAYVAQGDTTNTSCAEQFDPSGYYQRVPPATGYIDPVAFEPMAEYAVIAMNAKPGCMDGLILQRAFGRALGLLTDKSRYSQAFVNAVKDKSLFAFYASKWNGAADVMHNPDCKVACGNVPYSGNVRVFVPSPYSSNLINGRWVNFLYDDVGAKHDAIGWLQKVAPKVAAFR
jgi:hypothetical protein